MLAETQTFVDGLVNYSKLSIVGELVKSIKQLQLFPYAYEEDPVIAEFLRKAVVLDSDQLLQLAERVW